MDLLYELLTISDLNDKIVSTKKYIENIRLYGHQMNSFRPLFDESWRLPISFAKYKGKIAYIDWILRSDELYLNLNVNYYSTGLIKSLEAVSQCLALTEITDIRNVRTLSGKKFKKNFMYDKTISAPFVIADRIISPEPFAIIENGMEKFASRERIINKYMMTELDELAKKAVASMEKRKDENVEEWAQRLAGDVAHLND